MKRITLIIITILVSANISRADEGMWMVNAISNALVKNMQDKGLELDSKEIYSEDAVSLKDAIVSLDFGCTGSMVSSQGLLITNHHCAYSDVHKLSTAEHNYLEDGFFAQIPANEIPIKGKSAYFLHKVLDVTDEVAEVQAAEKAEGRGAGLRRVSYLIEKKYKASTGYEASLSSMWSGSKYYLALYTVYTDLRLVAAPPVSIAAFGGDIDNWEWPQHKCDFAMYRIYTAPDGSPAEYSDQNIPFTPKKYLKISTQGVKPGDYSMIMGYPGSTARYSSAAEVNFKTSVTLPISNKVRAEQMAIIKGWMDKDPAIRLLYADKYFSLSNIQENNEGMVQCVGRFRGVKNLRKREKILRKNHSELLKQLDSAYAAVAPVERNTTYYRETMVRGCGLGVVATRLKSNRNGDVAKDSDYASLDMRVEQDLFRYCLESFFENIDSSYWGSFHKELYSKYGSNYDEMMSALWIDRKMTRDDDIFKFFSDISIAVFNDAKTAALGDKSLTELDKAYTQAMYAERLNRNMVQYPDANSSMRLSYGTVKSFKRDGKMLPYQTFSKQILDKEDDSYDFHLLDNWRTILQEGENTPVNFISTNDITGGNSGSPVLNGKGEIIGLAFDGNKESLASDVYWVDDYNRCVNVDIRFVLWTLEHFAKADNILKELAIN